MEGVAIDYFNKLKSSNIPMEKFCSHLSEKNDQYNSNTTTNICIIIQFLL